MLKSKCKFCNVQIIKPSITFQLYFYRVFNLILIQPYPVSWTTKTIHNKCPFKTYKKIRNSYSIMYDSDKLKAPFQLDLTKGEDNIDSGAVLNVTLTMFCKRGQICANNDSIDIFSSG